MRLHSLALFLAAAGCLEAPEASDRDGDGYPDAAELTSEEDRRAFREWFSAIALAQAERPCTCWPAEQRDCAGLVRFAFREALRRHDAAWRARIGPLEASPEQEVARFHYPNLPFLGERPFRVKRGPYSGLGDFALAPTASRLVAGSMEPLLQGEKWERGDILYFSDPSSRVEHLMIVAGEQAVYHTGPSAEGVGEVRLVAIEALRRHPDTRWRPQIANPSFAGAYRWKILRSDLRAGLATGGG